MYSQTLFVWVCEDLWYRDSIDICFLHLSPLFQPIFYEGMQSQFMTVLLQVLVHKSHDLLQEEIVVTIYNMASVEFNRFYSEYLPQFLSECEGLDDSQKAVLAANFKLEKVNSWSHGGIWQNTVLLSLFLCLPV